MTDDKQFNVERAFEQGSQNMNIHHLETQGFKRVKVLDPKAMEEYIRKAVERVVSTQTDEEKSKIVAESQKELERLMKEHRAVKSRAELLESNKNELVEHMEALQRELQLKGELEEER